MKYVLFAGLTLALVGAVLDAAFTRLEVRRYRTILADVLQLRELVHVGQIEAVARSALSSEGFERWEEAERISSEKLAYYRKSYPRIPWGDKVDVKLLIKGEVVSEVSIALVDEKSGRPRNLRHP